jgi:hypothetical protein
MRATKLVQRSLARRAASVASVLAVLALAACSHILDVQYPGRIPTAQLDDPVLAPVLVNSVIGDFECAYSNYMSGSSVHSDEYETANSNVPLANWGERTITKDESDYSQGTCEGNFGMQATMHTARYQSEQTFLRLNKWTDAQVPGRTGLMATVRAYGGYIYTLMGEGFCQVAFDGNPVEPHTAALDTAEKKFTDAIALAQTAANTDILNMARVGLARTQLDKKNYAGAAATAALVDAGYTKNADRGIESARRWNKLYRLATQVAAYTVGVPYRTMNDPRVLVQDAGRGAFNSEVRLWVNTKYPALGTPMRLSSYIEAQLIRAEALAQQGQFAAAMVIINARRAQVNLLPLVATSQADAVTQIIEERRKELSFEGGHRLNDLLRYNIPWKIGTNPFTNRLYGTTTCWPHPTIEGNG